MFAAKPDGLALILETHAVGGKHGFPPIPFAHTCSPHTLWPVERKSASSRLPGKPSWTLTGSVVRACSPGMCSALGSVPHTRKGRGGRGGSQQVHEFCDM